MGRKEWKSADLVVGQLVCCVIFGRFALDIRAIPSGYWEIFRLGLKASHIYVVTSSVLYMLLVTRIVFMCLILEIRDYVYNKCHRSVLKTKNLYLSLLQSRLP